MRKSGVIYSILLLCIVISLGFTGYYFMKALNYDTTFFEHEQVNDYEYHFVLIGQEIDNPYHQKVLEGALEAAKESNTLIEFIGPKQTNIEEHIKLIEMAVASKVDGILTQGLTNIDFKPVIDKAITKGIPVITIDTDLEDSKRVAYVGTDNYQAGFKIGEALVEATDGKAKIGIITGTEFANNLVLRVQGFMDAISESNDIEVISMESSNISRIQAAEKAYQMLRNYPEITAFFGTSALDGIGIAQAIEKHHSHSDILVFAFDDLEETIELMKQAQIFATLKQEPYEMGYRGVTLLIDHIEGEPIQTINYTTTEVLWSDKNMIEK
ncbi:sugar-binding protein [Bacillus alkalicellulosilyticus]|uniref:sugar-binding protein n=1 Tax=Alkalihalobacterium alkalicellulosilyticum TaxID=1912214 RepID=UPI00099858E7|nr:sugar-binding protein [Bacillus alkalicellulosilyticus]